MVACNLFAIELDRQKFDGWTVRRVTVTGSMSKWINIQWKPVTSDLSQGIAIPRILEQMLLSIFVADIVKGIKCTPSQSADDTEVSGAVDR